jgi:hypothetical protein
MAEHDFALNLFPLFDRQNASIEMTSDAIVTTSKTISFGGGDIPTLDVQPDGSKLKDAFCYRDDYGRLLECREETVRLTPFLDWL